MRHIFVTFKLISSAPYFLKTFLHLHSILINEFQHETDFIINAQINAFESSHLNTLSGIILTCAMAHGFLEWRTEI